MRTPGLAAITMAFAIAACSDVAQPVAMDFGTPSLHFSGRHSPWDTRKLGEKKDQCDDNDRNDHRWGKHHRYVRFRHWGWRGHNRRHWTFRGHDSSADCGGGAPKTGSISGAVANEGAPAIGYPVFLLNADGSTVVANTTTDATGAYAFAEVAPGAYLVCEDNPFTEAHGFLGETRPQTGAACAQPAYAPRGFALTLAAEAALTGNNFSNMRLD